MIPASVLAGTDGGAELCYTLDLFSVEDLTIEGYTPGGDGPGWTGLPCLALWWRSPGTAPLWSPTPCGSARSPPFGILEDGFDDLCRLYLDVLKRSLGGGPQPE